MDGLSAGASVLAVISLAIQMGESAHTLVRFLETIADAPAEVRRLRDLVNLVFAIATGVRNQLQDHQRLYSDGLSGEETICTALLACQGQLDQIRTLLSKVEDVEAGRTLVSRSWARFRLALKKDDVAGLEERLDRALQVLNLTLSMNLIASSAKNTLIVMDKLESFTAGTISSPCLPSSGARLLPSAVDHLLPPPSGEHLRSTLPAEMNESCQLTRANEIYDAHTMAYRSLLDRKSTKTVVSTRKTSYWSAQVPSLGYIWARTITKTKKTRCDDNRHPDFEMETVDSRYHICPSFLRLSLEFVISRSGNTSPRIALHVQRYLTSETSRRVEDCMKTNDLGAFQKMLSTGEVSIDSTHANGLPLMTVSMISKGREGDFPLFLLEQGYKPSRVDVIAWYVVTSNLNFIYPAGWTSVFAALYRKIHMSSEFQPGDGLMLGFVSDPLRVHVPQLLQHVWFLVSGLEDTTLSPEEYLGSILAELMAAWSWHGGQDYEQETRMLLRRIITGGADLHYSGPTSNPQLTPLQKVVAHSQLSDESSLASEWLVFLDDCGIDLDAYLWEEAEFCSNSVEKDIWTKGYAYLNQRKVDIHPGVDGRPYMKVQERWIDPESPAALVLAEFNVCPDVCIALPGLGYFPFSWIAIEELDSRCDFDVLWPFHAGIHTVCGWDGWGPWDEVLGCRRCSIPACSFNQERFRRKQEKKVAKRLGLRRAQVLQPFTMPGSWVD